MRERIVSYCCTGPGARVPVLAAAVLLAACASEPSPARLVLVPYDRATPPDAACAALIEEAAARDLHGAFRPAAARLVEPEPRPSGAAAPPATPGRLVPAGSHPARTMQRALDGTFHSLFVDCAARRAWVSRRGGVADLTYWFGPFAIQDSGGVPSRPSRDHGAMIAP